MMDGRPEMRVGDVVCYRDHAYRVGISRTDTSIELIELNAPTRGLWVCRDEVSPASHQMQTEDPGFQNRVPDH